MGGKQLSFADAQEPGRPAAPAGPAQPPDRARRAAVERVFGTMKRLHSLARARCTTLTRNLGDMIAFAIVHNLRRAAALTT